MAVLDLHLLGSPVLRQQGAELAAVDAEARQLVLDLFDCVAATRNGRHGSAWTSRGRVNIRKAEHRTAEQPLDSRCDCATCARFSRGYLRHLFVAEEMLGLRLVSLHNVRFLIRITELARSAILAGEFDRWSREWLRGYHGQGDE